MVVKVAFLGPEGTYTHQAVIQQFGSDASKVKISAQAAIGDCFDAVNSEEADYAVVPFENSTNGQVVYTYDLLRDWFLPARNTESEPNGPGNTISSTTTDTDSSASGISPVSTAPTSADLDTSGPNFRIVAEQFVSIHHNFITRAKSIDSIKTIYSHPQVWTQVTRFMKSLNIDARVQKIDTSSTSKAAELVANDPTNTTACISSKMSSTLYNLPILYPNVEDNSNNSTRFLVLGRSTPPRIEAGSGSYIYYIIFTLHHDDPGALVDVLDGFKRSGVNLTSINSRPSHLKKWQYLFFVEATGKSLNDTNVETTLQNVAKGCLDLVLLGKFERSLRYSN